MAEDSSSPLVDRIVDIKRRGSKKYYLVHFSGSRKQKPQWIDFITLNSHRNGKALVSEYKVARIQETINQRSPRSKTPTLKVRSKTMPVSCRPRSKSLGAEVSSVKKIAVNQTTRKTRQTRSTEIKTPTARARQSKSVDRKQARSSDGKKKQTGTNPAKKSQNQPVKPSPTAKSSGKATSAKKSPTNSRKTVSSSDVFESASKPKRRRRESVSSGSSDETLYSLAISPESQQKTSIKQCGCSNKAVVDFMPPPSCFESGDTEVTLKLPSPKKDKQKCSSKLHVHVEGGHYTPLPPTAPKSPPSGELAITATHKLTPETAGDSPSTIPAALRLHPGATHSTTVFEPASPPRYERLLKHIHSRQRVTRRFEQTENRTEDETENGQVERRQSVRQTESVSRYKEIIVKKAEGYTQVTISSQTKPKNALNPKVIEELLHLFHGATYDNTRVILLTGSGNIFCSGVDLNFLLSGSDRRAQARVMANAIKDLVSALQSFPKPVVVAVNGAAVGLGVALLPLCDVVYASDKATFSCPYTQLGQTPEACSSYTLPLTVGAPMTGELLLMGRRITAMEACQCGLVSQVFWPTSLMQDVIPRVTHMASHSPEALESTKLLVRSHHCSRMEAVCQAETRMLIERWSSPQCAVAIRQYLDTDTDL